jgi:hypothetical protein
MARMMKSYHPGHPAILFLLLMRKIVIVPLRLKLFT